MDGLFIYDSSRIYSRLIKSNFNHKINIISLDDPRLFCKHNLSDVQTAYLFINSYQELLELIPVILKIKNIVISSNMHTIINAFEKIEKVSIINLDNTKSKILELIDFQLSNSSALMI